MKSNPLPYQGSCLCGSVKYQSESIQGPYVYCHCQSCRKSSGAAFAANISAPIDEFEIVAGEEHIRVYESSPEKLRHFCVNCGSPLFTKVGSDPQYVRIRLGSLDGDYREPPAAHIFVDHSAQWHTICDELPQYPEWPDAAEIKIPGSRQATSQE